MQNQLCRKCAAISIIAIRWDYFYRNSVAIAIIAAIIAAIVAAIVAAIAIVLALLLSQLCGTAIIAIALALLV